MATHFNQGDNIFFAFQNGRTVTDSQGHPRMYKSVQQFEAKFPGWRAGDATLVEYRPVRIVKREEEE